MDCLVMALKEFAMIKYTVKESKLRVVMEY